MVIKILTIETTNFRISLAFLQHWLRKSKSQPWFYFQKISESPHLFCKIPKSLLSLKYVCVQWSTPFSLAPYVFLAPFPWGTITVRDCGDQTRSCHIWTKMQKVKHCEITISPEKEQRQGLECKDDVRESHPPAQNLFTEILAVSY